MAWNVSDTTTVINTAYHFSVLIHFKFCLCLLFVLWAISCDCWGRGVELLRIFDSLEVGQFLMWASQSQSLTLLQRGSGQQRVKWLYSRGPVTTPGAGTKLWSVI